MKRVKNWVSGVAITVLFFVIGIAYGSIFNDITYSIQSGNASELAGHFGNRIELTILDEEDVYSRRQAEIMVREFFKDHPPESFEIIHKGTSNKSSRYAIGSLSTENGDRFRTYMFVKEERGTLRIKELRFEKQ